jgi:hypothetical protein
LKSLNVQANHPQPLMDFATIAGNIAAGPSRKWQNDGERDAALGYFMT